MLYGTHKYGEYKYGEESIPDSDIELRAPDLMLLLPWYYKSNVTIEGLQNSIAKELGKLYYNNQYLMPDILHYLHRLKFACN